MAQPPSPDIWRPHRQGRAIPITESPLHLVEQPRVTVAVETFQAEASQADASQPYPAADDAAIGDESMTAEEKRTQRRHGGSLRSSVSRGVTMLLSRRKSSRAASDTAQNDEEDFEYGEDDGATEQGGLAMDEQEEDADANCIVCMDAPRDSTVLPCRHMCATSPTQPLGSGPLLPAPSARFLHRTLTPCWAVRLLQGPLLPVCGRAALPHRRAAPLSDLPHRDRVGPRGRATAAASHGRDAVGVSIGRAAPSEPTVPACDDTGRGYLAGRTCGAWRGEARGLTACRERTGVLCHTTCCERTGVLCHGTRLQADALGRVVPPCARARGCGPHLGARSLLLCVALGGVGGGWERATCGARAPLSHLYRAPACAAGVYMPGALFLSPRCGGLRHNAADGENDCPLTSHRGRSAYAVL